jgi:hypothetical protein
VWPRVILLHESGRHNLVDSENNIINFIIPLLFPSLPREGNEKVKTVQSANNRRSASRQIRPFQFADYPDWA